MIIPLFISIIKIYVELFLPFLLHVNGKVRREEIPVTDMDFEIGFANVIIKVEKHISNTTI